jgi:signal transduction histidine kinase/ligand-binding sensor domain-containing protein
LNYFIVKTIKVVNVIFDYRLIGNHFLRWSLVISFFCFAGVFHLQAQSQYSRFGHLTVEDGLSSNRTRCLYRDSKDYLWIGTEEGLDKYNSYEIKRYNYNENIPGSISDNNIFCIYEDRGKNLWFGTFNGLNLFDPAKDNFKVFKNDPADKTSINGNYINGIIEDKGGNLWIVTGENCLNKLISKTQKFIRYQFDSEKAYFNSRPSKMIAIDSKGYLWLVSLSRGIRRFDPEAGIFTKFEDPSVDFGNDCFKSLYIDNHDKIWITTDGNGFFSYDPASNKFEQFGSKGDGKGTNQKVILDVIPEDEQHLLLAVDQGGINRFNKISKTFEYFMYDNTNDEGLNSNGIWCFHRDREGILWIGTSGGGINYYNPKKYKFKIFRYKGSNPNSVSYNNITCFYEDHQSMIWIGTDGGGVNLYDPEAGRFKIYKNEPSNPYSVSGNAILCISEDKYHDIWMGTWDAGLDRFDRKTDKFIRYMPDKNNLSSISGRSIWNLAIDKNDTLWLGTYNVGTDLFDKNKGVIRRFRANKDDPKAIVGKRDWLFFEDFEKNIWISTTAGLNFYDCKTNSFRNYNFNKNVISAFCKGKDGNLWVGTSTNGVYFCKPDGTILYTYDISNGLPSNIIQSIIEDNAGNIWVSSNGGISRFDRKTKKFRNYSKEDGLQGDQFKQQSSLITRKGEIYFGGYNGFNSFYPDSLKDNDFIPPVYITDFQLFNREVPVGVNGSQFQTHISEAKEIKLNWKQSVFSFTFSAINYTYPEKNKYAYIMEGFEKEWNYTNVSRRYVTYTNLNPGEYTFRVKASNNDGVWNEKGVSLRIIILPPWWRTLWFRLIIISTIIFIIVSIFLIRIRRLNSQKTVLERLVALKTTELQEKNDTLIKQAEELNKSNTLLEERQNQIENQSEELMSQKETLLEMNNKLYELNASKDKFFSIIAHDLKNPFQTIIGFSDMQKEEIKSGNFTGIEEYAGLINTSAIQTYRLLENLLEWANSQRGGITFKPVPINLMDILNEEFIVLNDIAIMKNIELKSSFPNDLIFRADNNMIKTILRNLISNAIKFTHKNGMVEVRAMIKDRNVEISVSDNGIGMTDESMAKLFRIDANLSTQGTEKEKGTGLGLFLCKEFVEKHGGKIWVESESGKGSTFKFLIPLDILHT